MRSAEDPGRVAPEFPPADLTLARPDAQRRSDQLPSGQRRDTRTTIGLAALMIAPLVGVLDVFIVNVAAPSIERDLGSGFDAIQLVVGGYMLAFAMGLVTGGRIGDAFGRRRVFLAGLALFATSSVGCAVAQNAPTLIGARVVQGLAAAVMMPQVLAIVQVIVPPDQRAGVLGGYGAAQSVGAISGQVLGGLLVHLNLADLGWRAIFLVNVPLCALCWAGTVGAIPAGRPTARARLDLPGVGLLSGALFLLLYPIVVGAQRGWPAWSILVPVASLAVFALFAGWELRVERGGGPALLPMHLFRDPSFADGVPGGLLLYTGNAGFYLVLAFFLQDGRQMSALAAAEEFLPLGVTFALASLASRRLIARLGNGALRVGALVIIAGLLLCYLGSLPSGAVAGALALQPGLVLCGIGQGLVVPSLIGAVLGRVHSADAGAAAGGLLTMSQVGNALGVAVVGAVFASVAAGSGYQPAFRISMLVLTGIGILLLVAVVRLGRRAEESGGSAERSC